MANVDDHLIYYREFFENFAKTVNPQDQLPVKLGSYKLINLEVIGAVIDWTTQYLTQKQCPQSLLAPLIQIVIEETRKICKKHPIQCGFNPTSNAYEPLKLMQTVMAKTNEICLRYLDNSMLCSLPPPGPPYNTISVCASKNKRRRMEDRHVVIHDLNTMFNVKEASPSSYYAIFDGHAGHDAAAYSAAHLHQFLAESKHFITNPEQALLDAFCKTDALFIEKCKVENFTSGTTAVCALLRPKENTLYIAWVGDSQALLVNQGRILQCVKPHKPCRDDEKNRIESQGGFISFWGTWRVNGQLAVSRAIGDYVYKPYITAIPEIREIQLDGGEDFLILGCDGLWDFLSEDDTALAVYNMVCQNPDQTDIISEQLVKLSKESGSLDNISVIVVFLREPSKIAAEAHWANRNGSPPIAMDTSLDNSNNPFANSNGSENTMSTTTETTPALATIDPDTLKTDGFLLNLSTENYKQNGGDVDDLISSPTDDFYRKLDKSNGKRSASEFDEDDDDDDLNDNDNVIDNDNERDEDDNDVGVVDDDLGPETDVDTADVLSPSILTAKALADGIINNNPEGSFNPFIEKEEVEKAALEIDRIVDDELQKQQISDDEDEIVERKISTSPLPPTTVTPPLISDEVAVNPANVPVHDVGSLEDNVADSGDDSEDEWNYIKGDEANKENLNPAQPEQEVAASFEEDIDNMSQLNPNAAEFVPVSPTRSIPSPACQSLINDPVISQSPKRASDIDLNVPNPQEFENEVKSRPSDVEACDNNTNDHEEINDHRTTTQELENLLNGKNIDEIPEFQPGTGLTPTKISHDEFHFGPNAAPFTPGKFLDQSEAGLSTRAVFGDESTATIASFDESAFGQDHIDLSSILNKEQDPMSMSFYQDKNESDTIDLNRVQPLPDDLDEFLSKPDEPVVTNTEKSDDIINLDNDERVQTTDLDKIIDDEKEIASPVDDLSDDICELPKSPDLITNDIIEKENEEEKEKEEIKKKEQINEKEEETKEAEIKEIVCDMISKSPELVALSPSPEPTQVDLLQNQNTLSETNQLIEEKIDEVKEQQQEQVHQDQPSLDDLIEHKLVTPKPEIEAVQEKLNMEVISPLPTHELLTSSPEVPIEALLETNQSEFSQTQETTFESDQCIHEEYQLIDTSEISTNVEKKEEESIIASPIEDVTSSVKDTISPVVMSPIPDQDTVPVSEQEISPVGESSPILQQQSEVLVPEICQFSPPESVATVEVDSFLERSDISDAHSPLEASPVAIQPIESVQLDVLDGDHPLSKCVYPLPTENEIPIKTDEIVEIEDNKAVEDKANKIEDNQAVEDIANKIEDNKIVEDTATIPAPAAVVIVEEVVEQKAEQIDDKVVSEVSTTTTAAAAVGAIAAAATAVTAATVVEKKTTDKAKIAPKKSPTAASKTASSKTTAAASKSKPPTTTKSPSRLSTKLTSNGVSQKPLSSPKTTTAASKLAPKPKTGLLTTTTKSTAIDKKPIANGDVKSTKSTTLVKKTEATKTTAKTLSSARPTSSTLNKISPIKSRPTTAPTKVSSSTTNKVSSITSTTTTASAKLRPATISHKPATTTKTSPTSTTSKTNVTKTTSSTKPLSSPRAPRPPTTTTLTAKPRVPLTKTITKTSADTEKQNKESANKLTASRSTTTTTTRTAGKTVSTTTLKKTEIKNSGTRTTATKTTTTITGKKPTEIARNIKATTTKTTKIEKPIQNGISSVVTEQIIVNNDNEPQLVKDNSPIDNKLIVEATTTD